MKEAWTESEMPLGSWAPVNETDRLRAEREVVEFPALKHEPAQAPAPTTSGMCVGDGRVEDVDLLLQQTSSRECRSSCLEVSVSTLISSVQMEEAAGEKE